MTKTYTGSRNALKSNICLPFVHPGGGRRLLTRKLATTRHPKIKNAAARTPHPNPTESNSLFNIIGKHTPPNEEPETIIPIAKPRFLRNQVFRHSAAVWKLL